MCNGAKEIWDQQGRLENAMEIHAQSGNPLATVHREDQDALHDYAQRWWLQTSRASEEDPGWPVDKQECVNHDEKRLYRALEIIIADCAEDGITLEGNKAGSLTEDKIKKLQGHYTNAIKNNAADVEANDFRDRLSSQFDRQKSNHALCPVEETSWCFWQRAVAEGNVPEKDTKKTTIEIRCYCKDLPCVPKTYKNGRAGKIHYKRDANECIHNSIWFKCPKNKGTTKNKGEVDNRSSFNFIIENSSSNSNSYNFYLFVLIVCLLDRCFKNRCRIQHGPRKNSAIRIWVGARAGTTRCVAENRPNSRPKIRRPQYNACIWRESIQNKSQEASKRCRRASKTVKKGPTYGSENAELQQFRIAEKVLSLSLTIVFSDSHFRPFSELHWTQKLAGTPNFVRH